jgi:hypothetical protein
MTGTIQREPIEWFDIWIEKANEEITSRVLLIGDSITKSYFDQVAKHLSGKAACARGSTSRYIGDPILLAELSLLFKEYSFSIIQFNNGLHGMDNPDEMYQENLPKVIHFIRSLAPEAKLIWASTTPWRCEGDVSRLHDLNKRVILRNRVAQEFAAAEAIPINDLYELIGDHPEYYSEDGVHLLENGRKILADRTSELILGILNDIG